MTDQERFIQEMKSKFGDLVDLRICLNGDGGFMAWDARVAFWAWQAAQQKDGFILVPVEPNIHMIGAGMGGFVFPLDGGSFSKGEMVQAYKAMIAAAQEPT